MSTTVSEHRVRAVLSFRSERLASMALPESLVERFGAYQPTAFAPTNDRRVVGSMLDYRKMFDFMVYRKGGLERADLGG